MELNDQNLHSNQPLSVNKPPLGTENSIFFSERDACHCKGEWVEATVIKFGSIDLALLHTRGDP